jgi:hypothetical protein
VDNVPFWGMNTVDILERWGGGTEETLGKCLCRRKGSVGVIVGLSEWGLGKESL